MRIVGLTEEVVIVPEHICAVWLVKPFRPVQSLYAHGWQGAGTLTTGARLTLKRWGNSSYHDPCDDEHGAEARELYARVIALIAGPDGEEPVPLESDPAWMDVQR